MSTEAYCAFTRLLRVGRFLNLEGAEHAWIHVPVCKACQAASNTQYRKAFRQTFLLVLGIGTGGGFLLGTSLALLDGDPKHWAIWAVLFSIPAGLVSLLFAWFISKRVAGKASRPVQLQRYLPEEGTVDLRFRRSEYAEQVLHTALSR